MAFKRRTMTMMYSTMKLPSHPWSNPIGEIVPLMRIILEWKIDGLIDRWNRKCRSCQRRRKNSFGWTSVRSSWQWKDKDKGEIVLIRAKKRTLFSYNLANSKGKGAMTCANCHAEESSMLGGGFLQIVHASIPDVARGAHPTLCSRVGRHGFRG